ncbi:hypothetical protein QBC43DRAFT_88372 [Cladorrhinum sp. PSN259]|nr:hypothetical protein QBC43DRAFT_88372 [Cladorrhinum sp. PSN259]
MSGTKKSTSTASWVQVSNTSFEDDYFTKDRPPHINPDNMSSAQVASASSEHAPLSAPKKLDSNKCSTETPGTDDTQIKGDHTTVMPDMPPSAPLKPSYPNNIKEWVAEVGLGGKFYRNYAPSAYSGTSSRSQLSNASSSVTGREWTFLMQPLPIDHALMGNGAWCEVSTGLLAPASGSLVLDDKE